jgi:high-affinity nickel permease
MNTVSPELLDARLETIESRMDSRASAIESAIAASIQATKEFRADTRAEIKGLKITVIVTAIASVLALGAINVSILSNMVSAFESGKNTAAAQADVKKQAEETATLIKKMRDDWELQSRERQNRPPGG